MVDWLPDFVAVHTVRPDASRNTVTATASKSSGCGTSTSQHRIFRQDPSSWSRMAIAWFIVGDLVFKNGSKPINPEEAEPPRRSSPSLIAPVLQSVQAAIRKRP